MAETSKQIRGKLGGRWQRLPLASACLVLACTGALAAGNSSSAIQFWLQEKAGSAPAVRRPTHPIFRPRRATATSGPQRRPTGAATAPQPTSNFVIAVFGDGLADDLAHGLAEAEGSKPNSAVFDDASEGTGLISNPPDWTSAIDAAMRKAGHADVAVVLLGSADLRALANADGNPVEVGSPAWRQTYGERVEQAASVFRERHIPLIWVGLPLVRDPAVASGYADLNAIVREHASKAGATFVDVWEAFADDNGRYDASGPDVDGRDTRLRRNDGVRFTRAGSRKLASFVEPELNRERDKVQSSRQLASLATDDRAIFDQALEIDVTAQIRREAGLPPLPGPPSTALPPKSLPAIDLTAAPRSVDGRLATLAVPLALPADADGVLEWGRVPAPRHGRTDDFAWPRR